MRLRTILLAAVVVLAAGCAWPMAGQSPDRKGWAEQDTTVTPANAASLTTGWTGPVSSAAAEVIGDRDGLVARSGSTVTGFDATTGAFGWSTGNLPGTGAPGIYSGRVFVGVSNPACTVAKLDRANGAVTDTTSIGVAIPGPTWTSTCVTGDVVIDGDTIIVPWSQRMTKVLACGLNTTAANGLTAFDFSLDPVWFDSSSVTSCGPPPIPPHNLQHVSRIGDRIVAASAGEAPKVYDPNTCVDFSICHPVASGVTTDGTWIGDASTWTTRNGTQLWNVDGTTSALRWRSTDPGSNAARTITADPAADDTRAFAPSGTGAGASLGVYPFAGCGQSFCGPAWSVTLSAVSSFRPSIAGDVVMVATSDKHLVLVNRAGCGNSSCNAVRTLSLSGTPTASPSIVAGRILVPTSAGVETFALPA